MTVEVDGVLVFLTQILRMNTDLMTMEVEGVLGLSTLITQISQIICKAKSVEINII